MKIPAWFDSKCAYGCDKQPGAIGIIQGPALSVAIFGAGKYLSITRDAKLRLKYRVGTALIGCCSLVIADGCRGFLPATTAVSGP
jgi:hypothetical protein